MRIFALSHLQKNETEMKHDKRTVHCHPDEPVEQDSQKYNFITANIFIHQSQIYKF